MVGKSPELWYHLEQLMISFWGKLGVIFQGLNLLLVSGRVNFRAKETTQDSVQDDFFRIVPW